MVATFEGNFGSGEGSIDDVEKAGLLLAFCTVSLHRMILGSIPILYTTLLFDIYTPQTFIVIY